MSMSEQSLPELTTAQFSCWRALIEEYAGVQIAPDREAFVRLGVRRRLEELGESSFDSYFERVNGLGGEQERRLIFDRMLIKETHFFRHRPSFDFVSRSVFRQISEGMTSTSAWSVGCSTGEEAYSIAMAINAAYETCDKKPLFGVVGSDISHQALMSARSGIYHSRQLKQVTEFEKRQYFTEMSATEFSVSESTKRRVCFLNSNIFNIPKHSFANNLDIIYCQNVLIYFKRWRRREIIQSLAQCLKPGGLLVLGVGECSEQPSQLLTRVPEQGVLAYVRSSR